MYRLPVTGESGDCLSCLDRVFCLSSGDRGKLNWLGVDSNHPEIKGRVDPSGADCGTLSQNGYFEFKSQSFPISSSVKNGTGVSGKLESPLTQWR